MYPISTPFKYQKTLRFSDVFRGKRKVPLGTNGLNSTAESLNEKYMKYG